MKDREIESNNLTLCQRVGLSARVSVMPIWIVDREIKVEAGSPTFALEARGSNGSGVVEPPEPSPYSGWPPIP